MRQAQIYVGTKLAGILTQDDTGYRFEYDTDYLKDADANPVSLTLPKQSVPYTSKVLFPFFDGLIPEGWLLDIAEKNWKLHTHDRFGLLLACCYDCIGSVSVQPIKTEEL
ncbi:MAG: phosphatidylinositol kinase [Chitinophagaceae bacterium]|nr:phosphatidylinositol kinase [Chitinophagaceae bacterium]